MIAFCVEIENQAKPWVEIPEATNQVDTSTQTDIIYNWSGSESVEKCELKPMTSRNSEDKSVQTDQLRGEGGKFASNDGKSSCKSFKNITVQFMKFKKIFYNFYPTQSGYQNYRKNESHQGKWIRDSNRRLFFLVLKVTFV